MNINIQGTSTGRVSSTERLEGNTPKPSSLSQSSPSDPYFDWITDAVTGVPFDKDFDDARARASLARADELT